MARSSFRCDPNATVVTIPASVTSLDSSSFKLACDLTTVIFEPGSRLTALGEETFKDCGLLKSICLPASLESLPSFLFVHCLIYQFTPPALERVSFESGSKLREIDAFTFVGCQFLKSICLPASVEKISGESFATCPPINIEIDGGNPFLRVIGAFIMDLDGRKIVCHFGSDSEIEIPDTVETIGERVFHHRRSIRRVSFGSDSHLREIENEAFGNCELLQSICIPSGVTCIPYVCFGLCKSLQTVSFASNSQMTVLGEWSFSGSGLESITIPSTVELLSTNCFDDCRRLTTVIFAAEARLRRIADRAFQDCSSLASFSVPSSVEWVGLECFSGCSLLLHLDFSMPCHLRELLSVPPALNRLIHIPDSVEIMQFGTSGRRDGDYALSFGRESKLETIGTTARRLFLQFSSGTLKIFRSRVEF
jgi:hypothetical protein